MSDVPKIVRDALRKIAVSVVPAEVPGRIHRVNRVEMITLARDACDELGIDYGAKRFLEEIASSDS